MAESRPGTGRAALAAAISRQMEAEAVEFADDDEHVYVLSTDGSAWVRYRLDAEARRVVVGEFPEAPLEGIAVRLLAPGGSR